MKFSYCLVRAKLHAAIVSLQAKVDKGLDKLARVPLGATNLFRISTLGAP